MPKKYTEEYKNTIVELYNSTKTLAELNSEYGLPKSTILTWIKKAKPIAVGNNIEGSSCVTVSIGVTFTIPNINSLYKDLFKVVDEALYQAKAAGRNQVNFL